MEWVDREKSLLHAAAPSYVSSPTRAIVRISNLGGLKSKSVHETRNSGALRVEIGFSMDIFWESRKIQQEIKVRAIFFSDFGSFFEVSVGFQTRGAWNIDFLNSDLNFRGTVCWNGVLGGHFLGIKKQQWNKSLS